MPRLVTIGYEGRSLDELVAALADADVTTVVDVRLTPISHKAGLSKSRLADRLESAGIAYVHLRALGNPKDNRAGLRAGEAQSRRRYVDVLRSPAGDAALAQLTDLVAHERVALLCVERSPDTCHRKLVADALVRRAPGTEVRHL
jgi:uncharacterized protein (DUF488 family)